MTELEILQRAKMYIDKMAKGINPLDDTAVKDDDIIKNVRISRCFKNMICVVLFRNLCYNN